MIADHFSHAAALYAECRPGYPAELFEFLAGMCDQRSHAWDAGTGSGQAAIALARHFETVIASDASIEQLAHARAHSRVHYVSAASETSPLAPSCIDLVCVAQAVHWFKFNPFYEEVRRVSRPGGIIALWTYLLPVMNDDFNDLVRQFWFETLGPYWPPERRYVDEMYRTLPFPFHDLDVPEFSIRLQWTVNQFLGYLRTWSAVGRYRKQHGVDPVLAIAPALTTLWAGNSEIRTLTWPVIMRLGRVHERRRG